MHLRKIRLTWEEGAAAVEIQLHQHVVNTLASCLIYSCALIEYINGFAVD